MSNTLLRIRTLASALGVTAALVFASCGDDKPPRTPCDANTPCAAEDTCWYDRGFCVPKDNAGTCEAGYTYRACETSSCPTCTDCVSACYPVENAP